MIGRRRAASTTSGAGETDDAAGPPRRSDTGAPADAATVATATGAHSVATDVGDEAEDDPAPTTTAAARRRRALLDWIVVIVVAMLVAFVVRTFVLAHFVVDGESMETTLHDADRVFVNKLSYHLHDPNRGDVVVLHELSGTSDRDLIKRVVALPGETIEVRNCQVIVDGRTLEEPYLEPEAQMPGECGNDQSPLTVPEEHVFVMGDNRGHSLDSRDLGPIDEDNLVGRAFVVFWPHDHWQWL